jgi:dephospho-CoA kinase
VDRFIIIKPNYTKPMKIIAFVGMPASGKSEAASVSRHMDIPVVSMGDVVREETARRGLAPTDENIGGTGSILRKEDGMDVIARRCVPKILSINAPVIVIDGTRNIDEVKFFKRQFGTDFLLIAIHAPREVRFERVKKRGRSDDMKSMNDLKKRDEREKGWGLDRAISNADVTIDNTGTVEKFRNEIEKLLKDP